MGDVSILKDSEYFIKNTGGQKLYIYGGGGHMWRLVMTGVLDAVMFKGYNWRNNIAGYIDKKPDCKPEYLQEASFYNIERFSEKEKGNTVSVFLCIGMGARHTEQYEMIIDTLKKSEVDIELMTIYDAVTDSEYYRKDLGIIEAPGLYKVINLYQYLKSSPWYFFQVYNKCGYFSGDIGEEIIRCRNNCAAMLLPNNQIGLKSENGFISIINGRRITHSRNIEHKNKIHMFGDSRMLCIYVNDGNTIASELQNNIYRHEDMSCRVLNYGMPGFEIERIHYQILHAAYKKGDIIVIAGRLKANLTAEKQEVWCRFMRSVCEKAKQEGLYLVLLHLPDIYELEDLTYVEQHILEINSWITAKPLLADTKVWEEFNRWCESMNVRVVDMSQYQKERYVYGEIYIDTQHYGANGNKWIADRLYPAVEKTQGQPYVNYVSDSVFSVENTDMIHHKSLAYLSNIERYENMVLNREAKKSLDAYLAKHQKLAGECRNTDNVGAIVMNCNPFTLGHQYLIERASKEVDKLIVFVVEENKSFFDIDDRLKLVQLGCSRLENVEVITSGKFMISTFTFPEYFMKEEQKDIVIDPTSDLVLFGQYIVPYFHIKSRFVGEEPTDYITRQYNAAMREVLEDYGVNVYIIPRIKTDTRVISASLVRKYLEKKDFRAIQDLVPVTTYDYLLEKFSDQALKPDIERRYR